MLWWWFWFPFFFDKCLLITKSSEHQTTNDWYSIIQLAIQKLLFKRIVVILLQFISCIILLWPTKCVTYSKANPINSLHSANFMISFFTHNISFLYIFISVWKHFYYNIEKNSLSGKMLSSSRLTTANSFICDNQSINQSSNFVIVEIQI